ncbi:chorismate mutase [Mycobacterium sp. Marseille-P9652]|uniref:chorismate mutase n=1 Tax=Mycobacterium sp. Marseille-P9652 TaxID=2654950 RepID=UPI0012E78AD1|nr:chorismate mutase [Mycobacterium sp. Marseille-P9652]
MSGRSGTRRPCGVLAALLALTAAPHARADAAGPLTALVDAAAQRLEVADPVAAVKWNTHGAIEDPARVRDELDRLAAAATADRLDPGYVTRIFGDQIDATEAIEYSRFADWKLDPAGVPATPPDLSASRAVIDGLNQTMLAQIGAHWDVLHSPVCAVELAASRTAVVEARRLDALYQRALASATRSYCQG